MLEALEQETLDMTERGRIHLAGLAIQRAIELLGDPEPMRSLADLEADWEDAKDEVNRLQRETPDDHAAISEAWATALEAGRMVRLVANQITSMEHLPPPQFMTTGEE